MQKDRQVVKFTQEYYERKLQKNVSAKGLVTTLVSSINWQPFTFHQFIVLVREAEGA